MSRAGGPAPSTRVQTLLDLSMSLEQAVEQGEHSDCRWEHVVRGRLSGVMWWSDLDQDGAVVVEGRIAGRAGVPWSSLREGWEMGDGSRARTVGEAVEWGRAYLAKTNT